MVWAWRAVTFRPWISRAFGAIAINAQTRIFIFTVFALILSLLYRAGEAGRLTSRLGVIYNYNTTHVSSPNT
jgi:hypothetical protein